MRLHRLALTAFGPFAGTARSTSTAGRAGLFLLHGPTGAGKTTLLDAVVFALYGRVPGARGRGSACAPTTPRPDARTEVAARSTLGRRGADHPAPRAGAAQEARRGHDDRAGQAAVLRWSDGGLGAGPTRVDEGRSSCAPAGLRPSSSSRSCCCRRASSRGSCAPTPRTGGRLLRGCSTPGASRGRGVARRASRRRARGARRRGSPGARRWCSGEVAEVDAGGSAPEGGGDQEWLSSLLKQLDEAEREARPGRGRGVRSRRAAVDAELAGARGLGTSGAPGGRAGGRELAAVVAAQGGAEPARGRSGTPDGGGGGLPRGPRGGWSRGARGRGGGRGRSGGGRRRGLVCLGGADGAAPMARDACVTRRGGARPAAGGGARSRRQAPRHRAAGRNVAGTSAALRGAVRGSRGGGRNGSPRGAGGRARRRRPRSGCPASAGLAAPPRPSWRASVGRRAARGDLAGRAHQVQPGRGTRGPRPASAGSTCAASGWTAWRPSSPVSWTTGADCPVCGSTEHPPPATRTGPGGDPRRRAGRDGGGLEVS